MDNASGIGFNSNILQLSNFNGKAVARAGAFRGMGPFGTFDNAGNVKEWTMNATPNGEWYILGGAWNEPAYSFAALDARTPLVRDETFGFRCVAASAHCPMQPAARWPFAPGSANPPVGDDTYRVFANLHKYDKQPLDSRIERTDDSPRYWRRETVSFTAAYPNDRVLAHLFLPEERAPPVSGGRDHGGLHDHKSRLKRVEDFDYPYESSSDRAGRW